MQNADDNDLIKIYFIAAVIFVALFAVYQIAFVPSPLFNSYLELMASLSTSIFSSLLGEDAYLLRSPELATKTDIFSIDGASVFVTKQVDAAPVYFILLSAILALPGKPLLKLAGAIGSALVVFGLNLARIIAMLLIDIWWPLYAEQINTYLVPFVFIFVCLGLFFAWLRLTTAPKSERS
ncbi:MAG: hypothetical protein EX270_01275 [Pseudomonadales bacterium]|nr:MAG: hypothetical protein EX270_01275 [Pseudomonadales bacterium]